MTCYGDVVLVHSCYCMTYAADGRGPFVGKCFYSCIHPATLAANTSSLVAVPCTFSKENLTALFCGYWGREGLMCGDCISGYAPKVYSFDLKCMPCNPDDLYPNLAKYMTAALLGPTVFLLFILLLRIKITSGTLNWFIFFSQVVSSPFIARPLLVLLKLSDLPPFLYTYAKLCLSFYGIWNLDFFRPFMPEICFSSLDTRQAIALDGVIAVYPLLFLMVLYLFIHLHDRHYKIVVFLWRPFHVCFHRCRQMWDIRNSVVDTFAAFVILSYSKILNFVFDVGFPTRTYEPSGKPYTESVYYDASIRLSDGQHLPYLVLTVSVLLLFNVLPVLLLCLYPTRCGRRILRCCASNGTLQILSDAFQGYYQDGTEGTRDLRFFPAIYFLARIILIIIYSTTLTQYSFILISVFLMALATVVALLQPYKHQFSRYNRIDAASILLLSMLILTTACIMTEPQMQGFGVYSLVTVITAGVMSLLPPIYMGFLLLQWFFRRRNSISATYQALINRNQ